METSFSSLELGEFYLFHNLIKSDLESQIEQKPINEQNDSGPVESKPETPPSSPVVASSFFTQMQYSFESVQVGVNILTIIF